MENKNQQGQDIKPVTYDLLPVTYFGPISWYRRLLRAEAWKIDDREHYVKQTTRNHCLIATANGIQKLTVPVEGSRKEEGGTMSDEGGTRSDEGGTRNEEGGTRNEEGGTRKDVTFVVPSSREEGLGVVANMANMTEVAKIANVSKLPITEVRISNHGKWRTEHWNALCTAYGESPFFDYYADDLRPFFERRDWEYLFDFHLAIIQKMLELLAPSYLPPLGEEPRASNIRTPLPSWGGVGGGAPYWQVYQQRHGFLPDLSILDLLCCMGPEAILYL